MLAKVTSCAIVGLDGHLVEVEVDISPGLPSFTIVGLPDAAVQEAKERVRAAIRNSGFSFPVKRVVVNLAPASLKKAGPAYDLPIAVGILLSSEQVPADTSKTIFLGELSLDGSLRHTNGVLPMVALAQQEGIFSIIVPEADAREASLVKDARVKHVKRAIEVAAAGTHNIVMCGPPGSGKTLLARSLPAILPAMNTEEALEVTKIYSISGLLPLNTPLIRQRPFRSPHYTISNAGLVGGGHWPKPGEISLSHRGVLFLDELPEFGHSVLEVLRQPLEDKVITISRAQGSVTFPANFMLVGAMNPCPCGYYGDPFRQCTCSPGLVSRYQKRISGPFIDRVDIFVEVPHIAYEKLASNRMGEPSGEVQGRVMNARSVQLKRFHGTALTCNAEMGPTEVREFCQAEETAQNLLKTAMKQLHLSARAFHRILKLARTIADLENAEIIKAHHLAEAIQYRPRSLL